MNLNQLRLKKFYVTHFKKLKFIFNSRALAFFHEIYKRGKNVIIPKVSSERLSPQNHLKLPALVIINITHPTDKFIFLS